MIAHWYHLIAFGALEDQSQSYIHSTLVKCITLEACSLKPLDNDKILMLLSISYLANTMVKFR